MSNELLDEKLIKRVQSGDKRAFDLLVLKYQSKVSKLVARFIRDVDEVQDVTQDAFIKIYKAIPGFRGESAFYTWIYRIAVNTAKNHLISRSRRPPQNDIDSQDAEQIIVDSRLRDEETPERLIQRKEIEQAINEALAQLPEDLRTAVTLREYEGMSYEEIAAVMDCPVGTVRSRIFRARDAIDQKLKPLLEG
jgi:RNA polymerase sigma-70 factor (ECF subfamily)